MNRVASAVQIAGLSVLAYGLSLLAVWLGVAAAGAGLLLFGLALERPAQDDTQADG